MSTMDIFAISASVITVALSSLSILTSKATSWWIEETRRIHAGLPGREEPRWLVFVRWTLRRPRRSR